MSRCPHCEYPLSDDVVRLQARCPNCRQPLHEPAGRIARLISQGGDSEAGESVCAAHPEMESVGFCARCNNRMCETCRTRLHGLLCCIACVDRALGAEEAIPDEERRPARQALAGVIFGVAAWVVAVTAILLQARCSEGEPNVAIVGTFMATLMLVTSVLPATLGVGLCMAALTKPKVAQVPGLVGLILGATYICCALGVGVLGLYQL